MAHTGPGPPQKSLVDDETRISLPAKPSLTRTTLGQLCVGPQTSRSRPVATEPGREPRVSGGTPSALNHCDIREALEAEPLPQIEVLSALHQVFIKVLSVLSSVQLSLNPDCAELRGKEHTVQSSEESRHCPARERRGGSVSEVSLG